MAWLATLALRFKLIALAVGVGALGLGVLYARYRVAKADAVDATARFEALRAARQLQLRVITAQTDLRERQRQTRAALSDRAERDGLDDQGWGP